MKLGIMLRLGARTADGGLLSHLATALDERGFESAWVPEHVVLFDQPDSEYPYTQDGKMPGGSEFGMLEQFTVLSFMAAVTTRIRLGTAICIVPQRSVLYTAKQVADLDVLSGGRVEFGVGVGWLREEFEALGVPWAQRGRRTDEHLAAFRDLWGADISSFDGELVQVPPCRMYPKPLQDPHPPVQIGGESPAAMARAARAGDGWFSYNRPLDEVPSGLAGLDRALADVGRDRSDIQVTVCPPTKPTVDEIKAFADLGVDRVVSHFRTPRNRDDVDREADRLAELLDVAANA